MILKELIADARSRCDDVAKGQLWSDAEWTRYANKRLREACRRARLIVDSTGELSELSISAGDVTTPLDSRILFVRRARLVGGNTLPRVRSSTLDCRSSTWEDDTGTPRAYVPNIDTQAFRPYPTPDADCTVKLTVVRLPMADMKDPEKDEPEIAPHLIDALVEGMLAEAYMKKDSETFDATRATQHEAAFTAEFGPKSSAIDETWLEREHDYLEAEGNF